MPRDVGKVCDGEAGAVPRSFCDRYVDRVRDERPARALDRVGGGAAPKPF
jgi:hypothetical protein